MKKIFLLLPTLFLLNTTFGQKRCALTKAVTYYTVSQPGILPVDENGRPMKSRINKVRFIYLLTSCKIKPVLSSVTYSGVKVMASVNEDDPAKKINAGFDNSGKQIFLYAPPGYYYWKADVAEMNNSSITDCRKIVLKGSVGKIPFNLIVHDEKQMQGLPVY